MTPERWELVKELLEGAWEQNDAGRTAYLDQACAQDPELRSRVESLLISDEHIGEFLAEPALGPDSSGRGLIEAVLAEPIDVPPEAHEGSEWIGKRIGRYTVTGLIGKGGMGAVYRGVREDDFQMQVAIKVLKRGTDTEAALSRFRTERQILAGLQHPNIARLLDGGATDDGLPYFAMEYVDGTPLLDYASPLPVRQRLELFRSVCAAVQHAHQRMIVHRDIKPANILVAADGVPKLLDFGIAKLLDPLPQGSASTLTATGSIPMTPAYASPEQVRGEPLTIATDIYSLGAVLYELLTGKQAHPMQAHSAKAIEKPGWAHLPKRPSAVRAHLDPELDSVVLMALRGEPERRYRSVEEFSDDLGRFLRNLPIHAKGDGVRYRCRKFLERNRVAGMAGALAAVLVLALVAGLDKVSKSHSAADARDRSIAVLPLENVSGDREQEYFAEGITDSLIGDLAQIPGLRVISRTSAMSYKGLHRIPEIARSLNVQTIVEGSVLPAGNRIRLAVRLVDARKDQPIWNASYEGELRDVRALQEQVAAAIASEIGVTLSASDRARVFRQHRVDLGAYDAYLKGRHLYFTAFTEETTQKAIAQFQQALALDPNYAPAYAGLADCYFGLSNIYHPPTEVMPKAKWAASKALDLDDTLGEAYATLALVQSVYEFDRSEAEKGFKRAIQLQPSNAQAHLWYGQHLVGMGRFDEAVAEVNRAKKLDPVSPAVNTYFGLILFLARRYDEMIQRLQPIADLHPEYHQPYAWLALAYEQKRDWAKAIAGMEQAYKLDAEPEALAQLGHIYAMAGKTTDARKVLRELQQLSRRRYVPAYDFAVLYAGLGERDDAFRWLQKVEQDRSEWFAAVNVDPRLDVLHADARFAGVLRSVGLAQYGQTP